MQRIIMWGTGKVSERMMRQIKHACQNEIDVVAFVDNDVKKIGEYFFDKRIIGPNELRNEQFDKIIIASKFETEIKDQIEHELEIDSKKVESYLSVLRMALIDRYRNEEGVEYKEILTRLQCKELDVFNYDFVDNYQNMKQEVILDSSCGLYYTIYKSKRMYFSKKYDTVQKVQKYFESIAIEQDEKSPHRYLDHTFDIQEGAVVIDAGVAEGNFALDVIDKVSKIYMIEADADWIEALKKTFEPYNDKVEIIPKFLSNRVDERCDKLDHIIQGKVDFIKMDIEGSECDALEGAEELLERCEHVKCAICSYHRRGDEGTIRNILQRNHMKCRTTSGYMWYPYGQESMNIELRRGIVRGEK